MADELDVDGELVAEQVKRLDAVKTDLDAQRTRFETANPGAGTWSAEYGGTLFAETMTHTVDTALYLVGKAVERADAIRRAMEDTVTEIGELDEYVATSYNSALGSGDAVDDAPADDVDHDLYVPDEDEDTGYWDSVDDDEDVVDLGSAGAATPVDDGGEG